MDYHAICTTAADIAREAGRLLETGFGRPLSVEHKSTATDWVTSFDRAAEALIVSRLAATFPDQGIFAEEGSRAEGRSAFIWYVDPLDGTSNFAHGYPQFSVSMALYDGPIPVVGIIYDPLRDELFSGVAGRGAWLERAGQSGPLRVSAKDQLMSSLLGTGYPPDKHLNENNNARETAAFLLQAQDLRRSGSAALDLAYVAAGRLDGFWEYRLNSWDVAAGILLITEAGGQVSEISGSPLTLAPTNSLIASNGRIHQAMVDVLAGA